MVQPLAITGRTHIQVNNSLSRMISLSILDSSGQEIPVKTDRRNPIEIIIPRDPNLKVSPMALHNVTLLHDPKQPFFFHFINITQSNKNLTASLHIEMRPLNVSLNYLLILKFDRQPQLNKLDTDIDDWSILCSSSEFHILFIFTIAIEHVLDVSVDGIHRYFISNSRTAGHEFVILGIRELQKDESCSNELLTLLKSYPSFQFSSDYELRIFMSACYYLDSNNHWQSDGLFVSYFSFSIIINFIIFLVGWTDDKS